MYVFEANTRLYQFDATHPIQNIAVCIHRWTLKTQH